MTALLFSLIQLQTAGVDMYCRLIVGQDAGYCWEDGRCACLTWVDYAELKERKVIKLPKKKKQSKSYSAPWTPYGD